MSRTRICAIAALLAASVLVSDLSAGKRKGVITKPKFNPDAKRVELFSAIKEKQISAKVIALDEKHGKVLIENLSEKPLTVELPKSFVGVHVVKQGFGAGAGTGTGSTGTDDGGTGGGGGGGQAMGGGMMGGGMMGGMGGGMMGGMGGGYGGGFFSVPPEKIVSVPYKSVCLEHGKAEPTPRMTYKLIPTAEYTDDPALQELIALIGTGKINQQVAQAAAWHLSNKMSWQELARKSVRHIGLPSTPYFHPAHLIGAQRLVAAAESKAKERKEEPAKNSRVTARVR